MSISSVQLVSAGAGLVYGCAAARCDVRTRRIPNRLVLLSLLTALVVQLAVASGRGLTEGLLAGALAALPMLIGYAAGAVGAGDVKLMAVMGTFAGLHGVLPLLFYTALSGGVFALLLLAQRALIVRGGLLTVAAPIASTNTLPYGVAICCGACAVFCRAVAGLAL